MNILTLLSAKSFLTVNKQLAKIVGLESAVLFADLAGSQLYWESEGKLKDGYFFRTQAEIEEQTTLSAKVQQRCCKELEQKGILKTKLKGLPAVKHYSIDESCIENLINLLSLKVNSSFYKSAKLDSTKGRTINNINNIEYNNIEYNNNNADAFFSENKDLNLNAKKEKTQKKVAQKKEQTYPENFSTEMIKAAQEFIEYRKEIKKPYRSEKSLQTKLDQWSEQLKKYGESMVLDSITKAIANGWQGTFLDEKQIIEHQKNKFQPETGYTPQPLTYKIF
jgi:lipase chaperone LimK